MKYVQIITAPVGLRAYFTDDSKQPTRRWTMPIIALGLTERGIELLALDPKTCRVGDPTEWTYFESFCEDA